MPPSRLNRAQRIVMVVGLGIACYFFGAWVTSRGTGWPGGGTGWTGYAPLTNPYDTPNLIGGLHPWVRMVIWLVLVLVWVVASVLLLRSRTAPKGLGAEDPEPKGPADWTASDGPPAPDPG